MVCIKSESVETTQPLMNDNNNNDKDDNKVDERKDKRLPVTVLSG